MAPRDIRNPKIVEQAPASIRDRIVAARRGETDAEDPDDLAQDRGRSKDERAGVSDAAANGGDAEGLPDPGAGATGGDGTATFVGAAPTGIDAIAAGGSTLRPAATITDGGRSETDLESILEQARTASPAGQARRDAQGALQRDAADNDMTSGIAEQGTGAIANHMPPEAEAAAQEEQGPLDAIADFFNGESGGISSITDLMSTSPDGEVGVLVHIDPNDPDFDGNPVVAFAERVANFTTGGSIRQADAINEDTPVVAPDAPVTGTEPPPPPGDEVTIEELPDGSLLITDENSVQVRREDGSSTTTTVNDDGTTTVTERDGTGKVTNRDVERPDPEGGGERFRHIGEGLEERLGPRGVVGGGDIDFGDDDFGTGAPTGQLRDVQGDLLGGDIRAGGIGEGPATSGFDGLDPSGNGGAIDFLENEPFGGGLEDDPFDAAAGPGRGLDDVSTSLDDEEATDGGTDNADQGADGTLPALADIELLVEPEPVPAFLRPIDLDGNETASEDAETDDGGID